MNFLSDLFSPMPYNGSEKEEITSLVEELVKIGKTDDFLSERPGFGFNGQCRHVRARQIGLRLHNLGGFPLMEWVYFKVKRKLGKQGKILVSHLEYAWVEVGGWRA
jgi:hypothetical protein